MSENGTDAMDAETEALYAEVQRNTRKAQLASLMGFITGLAAGAVAFFVIVKVSDPRSVFDLKLLFGSTMAGLFVGGAVRKMLLPDSMREEGEVDLAKLPSGSPQKLVAELGAHFSLRRQASILELAGLGSRSLARYDLLCGGALAGMVRETGSALGPALLGGERGFTLVVSDGETRALQLQKSTFGNELTVHNGSGQQVATIRRSRMPFVRTLVIDSISEDSVSEEHSGDTSLRLAKKWFSKSYTVRQGVRQGGETVADVRLIEEKDDMNLPSLRVDIELQRQDVGLAVLAGALAMDAI